MAPIDPGLATLISGGLTATAGLFGSDDDFTGFNYIQPTGSESSLRGVAKKGVNTASREFQALLPLAYSQLGYQYSRPGLSAEDQSALDKLLGKKAKLKGKMNKIRDRGEFPSNAMKRQMKQLNKGIDKAQAKKKGSLEQMPFEDFKAGLMKPMRDMWDVLDRDIQMVTALQEGGELPGQDKMFQDWKEAMGRQGVNIQGDTLEDAHGTDTPSIQAVQAFRDAYERDRQGMISTILGRGLQTQQQQMNLGFQNVGALMNVAGSPLQVVNPAMGVAGAFQADRSMATTGQATAANQNALFGAQQSSDRMQLLGYGTGKLLDYWGNVSPAQGGTSGPRVAGLLENSYTQPTQSRGPLTGGTANPYGITL